MFKVILTTAILTFSPTADLQLNQSTSYVYMCVNGKTEVYHVNKQCRGLKQCKHEIKKLSLSSAKEKELRLCGWED